MSLKIIFNKEDYKRYKKCAKISWILANRKNLEQFQKWIENKEISIFFDLKDSNNYHYDQNLEKLSVINSYKNYDSNSINNFLSIDRISSLNIINEKLDFYPGDKIYDGINVGRKAQEYFMKNYKCYNLDILNINSSFKKTMEFLKNLEYEIFFEPSFIYKNCITKCDILKRLSDGSYHLIEVKASVGKKYDKNLNMYLFKLVPKEYAYDVTYQYYVLNGNGIKISKISIMFLDPSYYKKGDIDVEKLFMFQEIYLNSTKFSEKVTLLDFAKQIVSGKFNDKRLKNETGIEIDLYNLYLFYKKPLDEILLILKEKYCMNNKSKKPIDYYGYCQHITRFLPEHNSVFELVKGVGKKTLLLYEENKLMLDEIVIPYKFSRNLNKGLNNDFSLLQTRQIQVLKNLEYIIDFNNIKDILEIYCKYKYPIYMYDFETMKSAIPIFDFSYSYQQIPFQYSIHIIENDLYDYHDNKSIHHFDYLSNGEEDPRLEFAIKLSNDLQIKGKGVYVAYFKSFECKVLTELIEYLKKIITNNKIRESEYNLIINKLTYIRDNTIDLMDFFNNFMIYKKEFYGSTSIKKVQPSFDNSFLYDNLKIKSGDIASELFRRRIEKNISLNTWLKYFRKLLLEYCNRDTLAMVIIIQNIKMLLKNSRYID